MDRQYDGRNTCSRPPAVDDIDLVAAADGDARPDVLAHLTACDYCASRASEVARIQSALRSRLFRAFCITSDDLIAYYHELLSEPRHAAIAAHLAECPHCARELRLIERAARDTDEIEALAPRRILARLLTPVGGAARALYGAPRAVASTQYAYRAENLELTLRVARSVGRPGRIVLAGTLETDDSGLGAALPGATAALLHGETLMALAPLDELGDFVFDDLTPGEYQLLLRLGDCEVVVETLSV